jgi:hypothetical protein
VIAEVEVIDEVAVNVTVVLEFSASVETDEAIVICGLSLSEIVTVTLWVPDSEAPPPETPEMATIAVSLPSDTVSSVIVNVLVPVVDPAEMVMVVAFTAE